MKDNFSRQADVYARYRPGYPRALFDFILTHVKEKKLAWDCATGNGQTAKELALFFEKVFATDSSQKQLDHAYKAPNIIYSRQTAEQTDFAADSFDLITVSQALHWLKFDSFYSEVRRVSKPGGCLAVWMYSLLRISPAIDELIEKYHFETMGTYWDSERKYVDDNYASVPFPFDEIQTPSFAITYQWTIRELEGYFNTWSALQKFIASNGYSPVPDIIKKISSHWTDESMRIVFPLHLRMAYINK